MFNEKIDKNDVTGAANVIAEMFSSACVGKKSSRKKPVTKNAVWWDDELELLKKQKYKCLRLYRLENSDRTFTDYCQLRKRFKSLIKKKKYEYKVSLKETIETCTSGSEFWKIIKSFRKTNVCVNKISPGESNDYFKHLLNKENPIDNDVTMFIEDYMRNHDETCKECIDGGDQDLDRDFTINEVEMVVKNLGSNKSPGIDGIGNECIKGACKDVVPLLCKLFNKILQTSEYPESWCSAIIIPIHKTGPVNDPNNYRGIALLSCISKVFTSC